MPKVETFDREVVLDKITALFWKRGFNGTSMQEIVDASGLNRSSLYNSFGDKFKLYLECLKFYRKKQQGEAIPNLKKINPRAALRIFYEDVPRSIDNNIADRGCLITNCTTELINQNKEIDAYVAESVEATLDFFRELILLGIDQGEFAPDTDVEKTVMYLYSSLLGLRVTAMQIPSKEKINGLIDSVLKNI